MLRVKDSQAGCNNSSRAPISQHDSYVLSISRVTTSCLRLAIALVAHFPVHWEAGIVSFLKRQNQFPNIAQDLRVTLGPVLDARHILKFGLDVNPVQAVSVV